MSNIFKHFFSTDKHFFPVCIEKLIFNMINYYKRNLHTLGALGILNWCLYMLNVFSENYNINFTFFNLQLFKHDKI